MTDDRQLSWDDLRALEALDRLGDVRSAARQTRQSLSTFYRRIAELERQVGQLCLQRGAGKATLTPFAVSLAQVGRQVRGGLSAAFTRLRAAEAGLEGVVSLTTVEALVPLVSPTLIALTRRHPGLRVELHPGDRGPSVRRREVDVALGVMARAPEGCWGRKLGVLETGVFGGPLSVKQRDRWLVRASSEGTSPEAAWEREHVKQGAVFRAPFHTLVNLCVADGGLALMPRLLGRHYGLREVEEFRTSTRALQRPLWCLTHPDLKKSPRVRALFEALCASEL